MLYNQLVELNFNSLEILKISCKFLLQLWRQIFCFWYWLWNGNCRLWFNRKSNLFESYFKRKELEKCRKECNTGTVAELRYVVDVAALAY